jgi:hypothetical protein
MKKQNFRGKEKESTFDITNRNYLEKKDRKPGPTMDDYYFIYWR